jgi:hypothetical protein
LGVVANVGSIHGKQHLPGGQSINQSIDEDILLQNTLHKA